MDIHNIHGIQATLSLASRLQASRGMQARAYAPAPPPPTSEASPWRREAAPAPGQTSASDFLEPAWLTDESYRRTTMLRNIETLLGIDYLGQRIDERA